MQLSNRPLIIGITGTIGSGKTTFCKMLERQYQVYYADTIAHDVLDQPDIIKSLSEKWGSVLINNSVLDRKILAERVFSDKNDLHFLNNLIHPRVLSEMQHIVDNCLSSVICFEVPLLFEAHLQDCFDCIILLQADLDIKIERISGRDNLSMEEITLRFANQMDDKLKENMADIIIYNNGQIADLQTEADTAINKIKELEPKDIQPFSKIN